MKSLSRLKLVAALIAVSLSTALVTPKAEAQEISGPVKKSAITNGTTSATLWQIRPAAGGGVSTNVPTGQANWVKVGRDGFGVAIKSYGTNAALTTNTWFTLEFSADGVNAITNNTVTVVLLPRGTATNVYYTNFVATSSATIGNIDSVRIKDVMQTNGLIGSSLAGTLFVEKFTITGR